MMLCCAELCFGVCVCMFVVSQMSVLHIAYDDDDDGDGAHIIMHDGRRRRRRNCNVAYRQGQTGGGTFGGELGLKVVIIRC